jgi:hypothetical protein
LRPSNICTRILYKKSTQKKYSTEENSRFIELAITKVPLSYVLIAAATTAKASFS